MTSGQLRIIVDALVDFYGDQELTHTDLNLFRERLPAEFSDLLESLKIAKENYIKKVNKI